MLAKFVEKISEMSGAKTFNIDGKFYSDRELIKIEDRKKYPSQMSVSGLDSIVKLVKTEMDNIGTTVIIKADSYNQVSVTTTYHDDFSRYELYKAVADVPGFKEGWRSREDAIIQLRSLFVPSNDTEYLVNLLARITDENSITTKDNGVTQEVEVRKGISLNSLETVKPRVDLRPFRTFIEVEQPESTFLLRLEGNNIGLFEADGGVWKLEAKRNVVSFFENKLSDLIEAGKVVVMC